MLFLCSFCFLVYHTEGRHLNFGDNPSINENVSIPIGYEEIFLHGLLDINQGPTDIEAYTDQNNVYVSFHRSFGNVSVTLYNPSNIMIYSNEVSTNNEQLLIIPLTGGASGTYLLELESANGYAEGEFEIIPLNN